VAIETTSGLVVDRLLELGHPVLPSHPNAFNVTRPRWRANRAKSDPTDSSKLADYLRPHGHRLRLLEPLDPASAELQALCQLRSDHVEASVAVINQLRALLCRHRPGAVVYFGRLDREIALNFLEGVPTPHSAARLGEGRLAMFCRCHSYTGRRSPAALFERLRRAPTPTQAIGPETLTEMERAQVRVLRAVLISVADLDRGAGATLLKHTQAHLLAPMPRIAEVILAQEIDEVGPILARARIAEEARVHVGTAPVTKESDKGRAVTFR
jgi:transposase